MIVVRSEIQCKWGRVQEVLESSRASYERMRGQLGPIKRVRILTDMSGPNDTVIVEAEVESLDAYFAMLDAVFASEAFQAQQAERMGQDHAYRSMRRDYYKIEAVYD